MPDPNARLTVHLAAVTSNAEPNHYMELRVVDVASRVAVCTIPLLAQDVMDLIGNRHAGGVDGLPAWLLPAERRHVLGLTMVHASKVYDCHPPTGESPAAIEAWWETTNQWADEADRLMGATSHELTIKHGKLHATFRCYVGPEHAERFRERITTWLGKWVGPHGTNR